MKILMTLGLLGLLAMTANAGNLQKAGSPDEVAAFLGSHDDGLASMFFYDAAKDDEGGILNTVGSLIDSVTGGKEEKTGTLKQMMDTSELIDTLAIDVSNPDFQETQGLYEVTKVPFVIVFNDGVAAIKDEPNETTLKKISALKRIQTVNEEPAEDAKPPARPSPSPAVEQLEVHDDDASKVHTGEFDREEKPETKPEATPHTTPETTENDHQIKPTEGTVEYPTKPAQPTNPRPKPTPARPGPTPAKPAPAKPAPAKPAPAKPQPAKPTPAKPTPAKPTPAKPTPAKPTPAANDHPTTVKPVDVTDNKPSTPKEDEVHLTKPAQYRHPDMKPFEQNQLANPDDYRYKGYIPVDHSMFQGENKYDGKPVEENEDVPEIKNTPGFYIDEVEDEPETEPDHDFHKPPFEEAPQFFTEPVIRHTLEPRPIP